MAAHVVEQEDDGAAIRRRTELADLRGTLAAIEAGRERRQHDRRRRAANAARRRTQTVQARSPAQAVPDPRPAIDPDMPVGELAQLRKLPYSVASPTDGRIRGRAA